MVNGNKINLIVTTLAGFCRDFKHQKRMVWPYGDLVPCVKNTLAKPPLKTDMQTQNLML